MEKKNDIELRSEEVQEVMGEIPSWIIRWGITLLTAVVLTLVIGSCFFRYPDVISTRMTLTSHEPVAQLVARSSTENRYAGNSCWWSWRIRQRPMMCCCWKGNFMPMPAYPTA